MIRSVSADDLLRDAREAAGTRNVREAVRNLTLHALRCRPLTGEHIATVARTVGEGIESSRLPPATPARETHRGAWAGLEDAVAQALLAVELAAREFAEGHGGLEEPDRERLLEEVADLGRSLEEVWGSRHDMPFDLKARLGAAAAHLRQSLPGRAGGGSSPATGHARADFSLVASGILVGLSEPVRGRAAGVAI